VVANLLPDAFICVIIVMCMYVLCTVAIVHITVLFDNAAGVFKNCFVYVTAKYFSSDHSHIHDATS